MLRSNKFDNMVDFIREMETVAHAIFLWLRSEDINNVICDKYIDFNKDFEISMMLRTIGGVRVIATRTKFDIYEVERIHDVVRKSEIVLPRGVFNESFSGCILKGIAEKIVISKQRGLSYDSDKDRETKADIMVNEFDEIYQRMRRQLQVQKCKENDFHVGRVADGLLGTRKALNKVIENSGGRK